MKIHELQAIQQQGLGGWFDSFCPSNGIADTAEKNTKSVLAEKLVWETKYTSLKNGTQAQQWADLKNQLAEYDSDIEEAKNLLYQENQISEALGLGAWCNGAVSRRKKAEAALLDAEQALGVVKGSFEVLEKQQTEGIKLASEAIETNIATLDSIVKQTALVKEKIANYKDQRDQEEAEKAQQLADEQNNTASIQTAGILSSENAPYIIGGLALVGAVIYLKNQKGKKINNKTKKVLV